MKKKLIAMLLSAAMCLSLAACGQKADTPDTTDPAEPSGDAATYTVGICQLVQHDALDAATRERLQAMIAACRGHCEQVLSTLGATCESVSNELKRADAAVAQLPEAFTTLEGQLDELKKLEQ